MICINFVYRLYVRIVIKINIECKDKPITFKSYPDFKISLFFGGLFFSSSIFSIENNCKLGTFTCMCITRSNFFWNCWSLRTRNIKQKISVFIPQNKGVVRFNHLWFAWQVFSRRSKFYNKYIYMKVYIGK